MSASGLGSPTPNTPEQEERTATGLMVFAVVSSALVVLVMIALVVVMLNVAQQDVVSPAVGPYDAPNRPVPDASITTSEALLPPQLGRFQRETIIGGLDDFHAIYTSGGDRIEIQGSRAVSYAAAQLGVMLVEDQAGPANVARRIGLGETHYSFYLSQVEGGVRYAWSHLEWFFDIQASSRQALDDFMDLFQY
ncbi:MAG: hypothetical protein IT323_13145 [Anaerolineae bacterium]|nr:hypothetical protein [Anaerolineae bacterium]